MSARSRTVRTLATLSLGLLLLPAASFAKSSSSSSSHSSSSSSHASTASTTSSIRLSKPTDVPKPSPVSTASKPGTVHLAKPVAAKTTTVPAPGTAMVALTAPLNPALRAASPAAKTTGVAVPPRTTTVSNASVSNWFGGHYEVFDRPGVNAVRVYRSNSAFSTARWLMDHKAYRAHQVINAGYELRTSGQVLDQGTPAFDRWIEQNR